jgi:hypothetical protein
MFLANTDMESRKDTGGEMERAMSRAFAKSQCWLAAEAAPTITKPAYAGWRRAANSRQSTYKTGVAATLQTPWGDELELIQDTASKK